MIASIRATLGDLKEALAAWPLWIRFGWHDILARYRRSLVGPSWMIASITVLILALGTVYSTLFKAELSDYLPYLACGMLIWSFVSNVMGDSPQTFVESEVYIRLTRRTPLVYIFRVLWRNIIIFLNQFVVVITVSLYYFKGSYEYLPLTIVGVVLLFLQAFWIVLFIGIWGARFRDLTPLIQNIMQIMFLITPIIWPANLLGSRIWIAEYNPAYHLLEVVRQPMLGSVPSMTSYYFVITMSVIGYTLAFATYARYRKTLVYWL